MTTFTQCSQAYENARRERSLYVRQCISEVVPSKRNVALFSAACLVATGAFWAAILTTPPLSSATEHSFSGLPVFEMMRTAPALPVVAYDTF